VLIENRIDVKFICTIFTIDSIPNLSIFPIERSVKETDDHEKADLEKELNKIEVTKYAMAFSNPNKSPGEDEIIGWCFSTLLGRYNRIDVKFICTIFTIDSIPNLSIFPIERKIF
jgi:hypothetical protein